MAHRFLLTSLCAADHRFTRHVAGTLELSGRAPDDLTIRMGSRICRNDTLVSPSFEEGDLDADPWARVTDREGEATMTEA